MREKLKLLQYTETILQSFPFSTLSSGRLLISPNWEKPSRNQSQLIFCSALCELWIEINKPCETTVTVLISNWKTFRFKCFHLNFVVSNLQLNWISFVWEVPDLNWKFLQVSPPLKFRFRFPAQQLWWLFRFKAMQCNDGFNKIWQYKWIILTLEPRHIVRSEEVVHSIY